MIACPSWAATQASFEWSPNIEADLAGYRIYSREQNQPYNYADPAWEGTDAFSTIYDLDESKSYYFVVRAINTEGIESENSNEIYLESSVISNQPPVADAGPDQIVDAGHIVTLNGSNSTDPDDDIASYYWVQIGGTAVNLSDPDAKQPIFNAPDVESDGTVLSFELTVTDLYGNQRKDICVVNVTWQNEPLYEDFGDRAGADPAGWEDTGANNSMVEDISLFQTYNVDGAIVYGTTSTASNIHSHYTAATYNATSPGFVMTGRMRMSHAFSGIGVTFLSNYPDADTYYRLRRYGSTAFHIDPHGTTVTGDIDSGVVPEVNTWYLFKIEVLDTGEQTEIRAKLWEDGTTEPLDWQIDAWDDSGSRRTNGKIGVWSYSSGSKYWDDLAVEVLTQ